MTSSHIEARGMVHSIQQKRANSALFSKERADQACDRTDLSAHIWAVGSLTIVCVIRRPDSCYSSKPRCPEKPGCPRATPYSWTLSLLSQPCLLS